MARRTLISDIGPVMQLAFVPDDFDAALRHWTETMGVGPFFWIEHAGLENAMFDGAPSKADFGIAIGYWGDIQIELIRQHNKAPSIFNTQPWKRTDSFHHTCLLTDDISGARQTAERSGARLAFTADVPGGGAVFYADPGGNAGLVEVLQPTQEALGLFAMLKQASADWDGSEPFRKLG